jgi:hypothetical protein
LIIDGFTIGVHVNGSTGTNDFVTLQNSIVRNNRMNGLLLEASDVVIDGNQILSNGNDTCVSGCGTGEGMTHGAYLGSLSSVMHLQIRNNVFADNTVAKSGPDMGKCVAGPLVVHGQWTDVTIENNLMTQTAATPGCYGVSVKPDYAGAEAMKQFVVRGNTIVNVGAIGIAIQSAPGILVENNVIVNLQNSAQTAIQVDRYLNRESVDAVETDAVLRNNSVYYENAAAGSVGITVAAGAMSAGSNYQVANNLVYFANGSANCFDTTGLTLASYSFFDNNLCYRASGSGSYSQAYTSLSDAQGAGFDVHGLSADPLLAAAPASGNAYSMAIQAGSPARHAANATHAPTVDRIGIARGGQPSIGAYEYVDPSAVPPSPPTNLVVM